MNSILILLTLVVWLALPFTQCFADSPSFAEARAKAEQGDVIMQTAVGVSYATGQGVSQDYAEAVSWWRKAADQGDAEAQYDLGQMYVNGQGVMRDYAEAAKWYRMAAEQGYAQAQYNLGVCYHNGKGVVLDEAEAARWWRKAADQGFAPAQTMLAKHPTSYDSSVSGAGILAILLFSMWTYDKKTRKLKIKTWILGGSPRRKKIFTIMGCILLAVLIFDLAMKFLIPQ